MVDGARKMELGGALAALDVADAILASLTLTSSFVQMERSADAVLKTGNGENVVGCMPSISALLGMLFSVVWILKSLSKPLLELVLLT